MPSGGGSAGRDFSKYRQVDIDFHRTISNADHSPMLGEPNPGMIDLMQSVLGQDPRNKIIVSCGGIGDYGEKLKAAFRVWLRKYGVDPARIGFEDKPRTIAVIDDHALQFTGDNTSQLKAEVLRRFQRLETQGPDIPLNTPDAGHSTGRLALHTNGRAQ